MIFLIKALLLFVSTVGTWEILRRNTNIDILFLPSLSVAIQVTILFMAGLLNVLKEAAILLWLVGIVSFFYALYREKNPGFLKNYFNAGYLFCFLTLAVMAVFVRDKYLAHYDNFSHWAAAAKVLIETNRFPLASDVIIEFQEYPLGSTVFIYYFAKLLDRSNERIWMLAQIYSMIVSVMPLFTLSRKNKVSAFVIILSFTSFVFVYNNSVTDLLVDTLLPLVSMCALHFLYAECFPSGNRKTYLLAGAYFIQIIQIKNSGIFFVLAALVCTLVAAKRRKLTAFVPEITALISMFLWHKHCRLIFPASEYTPHAMTKERAIQIIFAKSPDDIRSISLSLAKWAITNKELYLALGLLAAAGILIFLFDRQDAGKWKRGVLFSLIIYITYQIGLLGMYLFSMFLPEALILAGCERYTKTIIIAIVYVCACLLLTASDFARKKSFVFLVPTAGILLLAAFSYFSLGRIVLATDYVGEDPTDKMWIDQIKSENIIPSGNSYALLMKDDGRYLGALRYMARYSFVSKDVGIYFIRDASEIDEISEGYLLINDTDNTEIQKWVSEHYPEQTGRSVIVRY